MNEGDAVLEGDVAGVVVSVYVGGFVNGYRMYCCLSSTFPGLGEKVHVLPSHSLIAIVPRG